MTIQGSSEGYTPISAQPEKINGPHIRRLGKMGPNALQGTANTIAQKAQEQQAAANNAMANRPPSGPTYKAAPMTVSKPPQKLPPAPPTNAAPPKKAETKISKPPDRAPPLTPMEAEMKKSLAQADADVALERMVRQVDGKPAKPVSAAQIAHDKAMIARNLAHFQHLQQTASTSNSYLANNAQGSVREQVVYGQLPPNDQAGSTVQYGKISDVKVNQSAPAAGRGPTLAERQAADQRQLQNAMRQQNPEATLQKVDAVVTNGLYQMNLYRK